MGFTRRWPGITESVNEYENTVINGIDMTIKTERIRSENSPLTIIKKSIVSASEVPKIKAEENSIISHELLNLLGQSTNLLVYCLFCNTKGKLTREEVRFKIRAHKDEMEKQKNKGKNIVARTKIGKATINYWIDHLVQKNLILKENSNPVRFWKNEEINIHTQKPMSAGWADLRSGFQ